MLILRRVLGRQAVLVLSRKGLGVLLALGEEGLEEVDSGELVCDQAIEATRAATIVPAAAARAGAFSTWPNPCRRTGISTHR